MNDILKELVVECGIGRRFIHPASPDGKHVSIDPTTQKNAEKLYELILKQCINVVDKKNGDQIKKHFGIK